jgi:hypothetical protein
MEEAQCCPVCIVRCCKLLCQGPSTVTAVLLRASAVIAAWSERQLHQRVSGRARLHGHFGAAMPSARSTQVTQARAGKAVAAEALLKARLEEDPNNASLLCSMGDLTKQTAWYEKAWEASGHTDGRRCVMKAYHLPM